MAKTLLALAISQLYSNGSGGLISISPDPGGEIISITGAVYGTKSGTAYYDDFESRDVGPTGSSVGGITVSYSPGVSVTTADSYSGSRCVAADYAANDFPKLYYPLSGPQRVYMSCMYKITGSVPGVTVWKMARIGAGVEYSGVPRAGSSYTGSGSNIPQSFGGEIVNSNGITSYAADNMGVSPGLAYAHDEWLFYEIEFDAGSIGNSDAVFIERVSNLQTVVWENRPYLTPATPNLPTWLLTPLNGLDNSPPTVCLMDEFYIDESRARVIMTDANDYASSQIFAMQHITQWSSSSISIRKNAVGFLQGQQAYLHVFNDVGQHIQTVEITV